MNSNHLDTMRCINNLNVSPATASKPSRLSPRVMLGVKLNILKTQDEPRSLLLVSPRSSGSLESPSSSSQESGSRAEKYPTSASTVRNVYYRYTVRSVLSCALIRKKICLMYFISQHNVFQCISDYILTA